MSPEFRELMTDADRIMPGEGDFQFDPLLNRLRTIGYGGPVSLELMNPELWHTSPQQVLSLGHASLTRLLAPSH